MSETRRLLVRGLHRGFAMAGRAKGLTGTEEEVVVDSIAHVAADLILAGQGRDALAILAQAAPKGDDGVDPESPLQKAMARLPGLQNGTDVPRAAIEHTANAAESRENTQGPTDNESVGRLGQPFFAPQQTLLPPTLDLPAPSENTPGSAGGLVIEARGVLVGPGGVPPTPHPGTPPPSLHLDTENFEKNRGGA